MVASEARNGNDARTEGLRYIESGEYEAAIKVLSDGVSDDPSGETDALLGLANFQRERYNEAAEHYADALARSAESDDWRRIRDLAAANAAAEAHVAVPDVVHFERDPLLAPPPSPALPIGPATKPRQSLALRVRRVLGDGLGAVMSAMFTGITSVWGRVAGYRDRVWTNWYRRPFVLGVLTLAYMRERLNEHNLKSTYPPGTLIGFQQPGQEPPPGVVYHRTPDGTWNNLEDPMEGAALTRFPRNVSNEAIRPETGEELITPSPREISRRLLARQGEMKEVPFLNMLAAVWIQFQNHDWITHGDNLELGIHEIPLAEDDPARRRYHQTKMFVGKTQPDPTRMPEDVTPVTFINEVTHWWDGSQIYGSDQATQDRLRSGVDGKMKLHPDETLPLDRKNVEDSGMVRNWWVGLSMFHLLFVQEHNAICDHLKASYPQWDDHRLFNVARLVNAAVMAKIHSVEWTPAILPNRGLDAGLNANWYGLLTNQLRARRDQKTVADLNVRNPELGGVVGNPINKHDSPYGLTEEFVEVYRLHSLLPETLQIRSAGNGEIEEIPFPATRQAGSRKVTERVAMADLFYSFGNQHPGQLVLHNFPNFMRELSVPGIPLLDMAAIDILRARERGVPRYNEFRRQLGLNPIDTFDDLADDAEVVREIDEIYGGDVEKLDLLVGTLAEGHRPTGFGFGETMFQIFILNATRRLQADRFYTDYFNEETYTPEGLAWVDAADLKTVLLRHYPGLADTGLANVTNAFEPWDTDKRLDPERHPLRRYNRDLKKDPWLGDAYRR